MLKHLKISWLLVGAAGVALTFLGFQNWRPPLGKKADTRMRSFYSEWLQYSKMRNVRDIWIDSYEMDKVWFIAQNGVFTYHKTSGKWFYFGPHNGLICQEVISIAGDSSHVFFGTACGVCFWDRKSGKWEALEKDSGKRSFCIAALALDGDTLWIAQKPRGLRRYRISEKKYFSFAFGAPDNKAIHALAVDSQSVYCGGSAGLLYVYDKKSGSWRKERNAQASSMGADIRDIQRFGKDLWLATSAGIWQYEVQTGAWRGHGLGEEGSPVAGRSVSGDSLFIWAATDRGLARYEKKRELWLWIETLQEENRRPYDITSIACDDGYVWCGTTEKGAAKCFYDRLEIMQMPGGLTHNRVCALGADGFHLWTGYGGAGGAVDLFQKDSITWEKNMDAQMGNLSGDRAGVIRCWDDCTLVGTNRGFSLFDRGGILRFASDSSVGEVRCAERQGTDFFIGGEEGIRRFSAKEKKIDFIEGTEMFSAQTMVLSGFMLWAGARDGRMGHYDLSKHLWKNLPDSRTMAITAMAVWQGKIYVAFGGDSLYVYSPADGSRIKSILAGPAGVAANARPAPRKVTCMKVIDDRLWIATSAGIAVLDPAMNRRFFLTQASGLSDNEILVLDEDPSHVYIGTSGGLNKVRKAYLKKTIFKG